MAAAVNLKRLPFSGGSFRLQLSNLDCSRGVDDCKVAVIRIPRTGTRRIAKYRLE